MYVPDLYGRYLFHTSSVTIYVCTLQVYNYLFMHLKYSPQPDDGCSVAKARNCHLQLLQ